MLDSIPGYLNGLDYTALGKVANRTYANGLISQIDYYGDSFRLKSFKTGSLQNLSYSYDNVGNVLTMSDYANGSLWSYGYDPLDRLVNATEANGINQTFAYNSIGNIMQVNDGSHVVNYSYGLGAGPHAVTSLNSTPYQMVYGPSNISLASSTGVSPVYDSDWNVTVNSSASGGRVRLNQSKTLYARYNICLIYRTDVRTPLL